MSLPQLNGPALFRDAIPLAWEFGIAVPSDWEMDRYLQVLADFEQPNDFVEDTQQKHNAKSDLMLLWLARSLHTQMPAPTSAVIGLECVIWHSSQAIPIAQTGVVALCLSDQFPMLLKFSAQIVTCSQTQDGFEIKAAWLPMSSSLLDSFEKTIFRYHRRHIHQLREGKV